MTERYEKTEIAVSVAGLTKSFGDVRAVQDLSFTVATGEVFSLLGVNGAGKTTTMRMLMGLFTPDSGAIALCGHAAGSPEARRLLGFSPQETAVANQLTVTENLALMAEIYALDHAAARVAAMTTRLGLDAHRNKRAKVLSGGLKRRLSIGMALIAEPQVLLLDEPTLGLDVLARRELWGVLDAIRASRSLTVLLTTHYMEEAEALSDRIAVLQGGAIRASGTMAELRTATGLHADARLEDVFIRLAETGKEGRYE